ncbi:hypothetical protein [Paraclostridium bifermentans]|uniref:hypothetical protein n=1 Tax=Paraclostridium bifermentans TaxID=1490 RepID=UPI0029062AFA|nr:hypothetical protein [Paraclostridium bifermentans]MDU3802257.1 hypothetical protein [Paraclostridium bifermentans]
MIEFLKNIKEVFYDFIGYILPGFFALIVLLLPLSIRKFNSPIYSIIYMLNFPQDIPPLSLYTSLFKNYILVLLASFLLGHIFNGLGNKLCKYKIFKSIINVSVQSDRENVDFKFSYLSKLKNECWNLIKNNSNIPISIFSEENVDLDINKSLLITYATTNSRFESANNLIQKYISKTNMYASLCCITFLLMLNTIFSGIYIMFNISTLKYNSNLTLISLICFFMFFYTLFTVFYNEFYRHTKLKEKECYFFIMNKLSNK